MGDVAKSFQEVEQQGGLAHPRLRHQHLEAKLTVDSVDQGSQGFTVSFTVEKKARIGSPSKGVLLQSKVDKQLVLHGVFGGVARQWAPVQPDRCKSTAIVQKPLVSRISEDRRNGTEGKGEKVKAIAAKDQRPRSLRHLAFHRWVISQIGRPAWLSGHLAGDDFKDALLTGSISPVVLSPVL